MKINTYTLIMGFFAVCLSTSLSFGEQKDKKELSIFKWEKRLLIVNFVSISETLDSYQRKINLWLKKNECQFNERNLILIVFVSGINKNYVYPKGLENKNGLWLIGYDGYVKSYSEDLKLLESLFEKIDRMPIRKKESKMSRTLCLQDKKN
jgi:hypothetical protein